MAIFGPKAWVNPLGKMSIFRLFELLVFFSLERPFLSRISKNTLSGPILPKNKKFEKSPFLDQNHRLTPLEKCQFFDFFNFFFLQPRKPFFRSREYLKRHFPSLYCLIRKLEKWPFLDQNHRLTPLEKCQFFDFF